MSFGAISMLWHVLKHQVETGPVVNCSQCVPKQDGTVGGQKCVSSDQFADSCFRRVPIAHEPSSVGWQMLAALA